MAVVSAELSSDEKRVQVYFRFDFELVKQMNKVPGARFRGKADVKEDDVPHWTLPLDVETLRIFSREMQGNDLRMGPKLKKWGRAQVNHGKKLRTLAKAQHADLKRVPILSPDLAQALFVGPLGKDPERVGYKTVDAMEAAMRAGTFDLSHLEHLEAEQYAEILEGMTHGSYQQADTAFMALEGDDEQPHCPANFNHPGTGKTLEIIGAVLEAGMEDNSVNIVCAPKTSLESVWGEHLRRWQHLPVLVAPDGRSERVKCFRRAQAMYQNDEGFWLVVNPDIIRCKRDPEDEDKLVPQYKSLFEIDWDWFVIDEFHLMGLGNTSTLSYKSFRILPSYRRMATSGTPIGGKPLKIFGVLQFLRPDIFTSKWRWADQWLEVSTDALGHKTAGDVRKDREDEFYDMLSQYAVRRTKDEVLPWLPDKDYIDIWCTMTGQQSKQYREFALAAEIKIEDENLSATSILAEYTRLKQFAFAACDIRQRRDGTLRLVPRVETSAKLPEVQQILEELGIWAHEGDEKVVIFSQFSEVVDAMHAWLEQNGVKAGKITGAVTGAARDEAITAFQNDPEPRVMCVTTTAGGVSITLDRASTVIVMDETWTPDDQEQAEDRCHRGSRTHQVTVYYLRTKQTIEEKIWNVNEHKRHVNFNILDARRKGLSA